MKTNSKVSKIFLAKYFAGNIMAAFAQVFGCAIMIRNRRLTCTVKAVCYLSHQIGMVVSLTSLLVLTWSHYNYVNKRYFITPVEERRILRKSVVAAFLLDIIGITFVCIPIFCYQKISLGFIAQLFTRRPNIQHRNMLFRTMESFATKESVQVQHYEIEDIV